MSFIKKPSVYISLCIVVALVAGYTVFASPKGETGETVTVTTGNITQQVIITGTVEAARKVSLSFDRSGSIRSLPYPVGTKLAPGTIIASLYNEAEQAAMEEQKALVAIAETKLAQLKIGTRTEELKLKESEVRQAQVALTNTASKTGTVISDAYSAAEEAVNRYAAPFFVDDDTTTPRLTYSSGTQTTYDAEAKRLQAGNSVKAIQKILTEVSPSIVSLESSIMELRVVQDLFVTLGLTLRDANMNASTLTDYRERVTSARTALTTAISDAQNHINTLRDEAAEVDRVSRALELAQAKATPEDTEKAEQEVLQAKAKLRGASSDLEKTVIRAPFSGQISSKNVEVGETVTSGESIMEFLGTSGFTIEADVPEADITKIRMGDSAEATLDAYGSDLVFTAKVIEIEPAATEVEGVSTYKTTFSIEKPDARIRSGMTANITIKRMLKENTTVISTRAISTENGTSYAIKRLSDGTTEKVAVKLGSRNDTGDVEVLEGLAQGDIVFIPKSK